MTITTLALAAAVAFGPLNAERGLLQRELAKVTAGAQCRYANGSKAVVLKTKDPHRRLFILRDQIAAGRDLKGRAYPAGYHDTLELLEFDKSGDYQTDANGGVTMHHMIFLAVDHLLKQPNVPVSPKSLDAFLRTTKVPKCARATFDADLYETR